MLVNSLFKPYKSLIAQGAFKKAAMIFYMPALLCHLSYLEELFLSGSTINAQPVWSTVHDGHIPFPAWPAPGLTPAATSHLSLIIIVLTPKEAIGVINQCHAYVYSTLWRVVHRGCHAKL